MTLEGRYSDINVEESKSEQNSYSNSPNNKNEHF